MRKELKGASCPSKISAALAIYGAYDGEAMLPSQMDSRSQLPPSSRQRTRAAAQSARNRSISVAAVSG